MRIARQLPLLTVISLALVASPGLAAAETPPVDAATAAVESAASEASSVTEDSAVPAESPAEAPPPPPAEVAVPDEVPATVEDAAPPPPPAPAPQAEAIVGQAAKGVETAAGQSLPSPVRESAQEVTAAAEESVADVRQQVTDVHQQVTDVRQQVTDTAQKGLAGVADRAAEGKAILDVATGAARAAGPQPLKAASPRTAAPSSSRTSPPVNLENRRSTAAGLFALPPASTPKSASADLPLPPFVPSGPLGTDGLQSSVTPVSAHQRGGNEGHHLTNLQADQDSFVVSSSRPQASAPADSSGNRSPAGPAPSGPALASALAAAAAGGGTGSALLFALLAMILLIAPSFASKLRMNAGNCRPAPFVSLLERPG